MAKYQYDETGGIFTVFLLTILAIVLVPATFFASAPSKTDVVLPSGCSCAPCTQKRSRAPPKTQKSAGIFSTGNILLIVGWVLFAFIAYKASVAEFAEPETWDPYQILGIDTSADDGAIKSAFRKLSLKLHPDKVVPSEKDAAAQKFVEVSKAYKVLTDEEARKIFDETGHPDGKQAFELGLALPKWLIEEGNRSIVLLFYTLAFGIGLPVAVARWWSHAKHVTNSKILNETMAVFYRELKDGMPFRALLEVLSKAVEFESIIPPDHAKEYDHLADKVKEAMESKTVDRFDKNKKQLGLSKDPATLASYRAWLLINAHLLRITPEDPALVAVQRNVIETSVHLITGMLQIATSRHWVKLCAAIVELSQTLVQAVYYRQSPLYQLPFLDAESLKHFQTKKRNISTIQQFVKLDKEEKRNLVRSLEDDQFKTLVDVAGRYPVLKIVRMEYSVLGEPAIIPGAIVTLSIKLRAVYNDQEDPAANDEFEDIEEDMKKKKWWVDKRMVLREPHAPYFPATKKPTWYVMLANPKEGHLICMGKAVGLDEDKTVRLQFQSPPQSGSWMFQLLIKSDTYVGADVVMDTKLTVQEPSAAPIDSDGDDISEPDEDTIAGQMKALRNQGASGGLLGTGGAGERQKVRQSERMDYDDSTDSEDEYDEEEDPGKPEGFESESDDAASNSSDFVE